MNLRRNLGKNIRQWREKNALSQEAFADLVGLHRTYISQIEGEKRAVTIDVIQKMAEAMKISPIYLIGDQSIDPNSSEPYAAATFPVNSRDRP